MTRLELVGGSFAVCRMEADAAIPEWAATSRFFSITRTRNELSVVCDQRVVPSEFPAESDFQLLRVIGPLHFDTVGIISSLSQPLAAAGIPIFCISTFETDYLLVRDIDLKRAAATLQASGFSVDLKARPDSFASGPLL